MFAVLDPSIISISEDEWVCDESRDNFIEHLLNTINGIEGIDDLKLAWSEENDEMIWESPQRPPWRSDRFFNNSIIQILYNKITKNANYITLTKDPILCQIYPGFSCCRDDLSNAFKQKLLELHEHCHKIYIPHGLKNLDTTAQNYLVNGELLSPNPIPVADKKDYLSNIDIVSKYWPDTSLDDNKLKTAVNLVLIKEHNITLIEGSFSFSKSFLRKLSKTTQDKEKIVVSMAKRLSLTTSEAGRDVTLRDENITGKKNIRRFRVTPRPSSKRIHYKFNSANIEFMMFYDAGEHDDGL